MQENEKGTPGGVGQALTASALSCLDPRALGWQVLTEQVQENRAGAIHGGTGTGGPTWSLVIRECPRPSTDPRVTVDLRSPGVCHSSQLAPVLMSLPGCMEAGVVVGWWCMSWEATDVTVISNAAQLCTETSEGTSLVP